MAVNTIKLNGIHSFLNQVFLSTIRVEYRQQWMEAAAIYVKLDFSAVFSRLQQVRRVFLAICGVHGACDW